MAESLDIQIPWPGWRAVRRLGGGSYGSVWEIDRDVEGFTERSALKVMRIPAEQSAEGYALGYDDDTLSRSYGEQARELVGEYQLVRSLGNHPNVVASQDVATVRQPSGPGWDVLIRMELLTPLVQWIGGRRLTDAEVATLGRDIARALAACEKKGIIHRDVKPANIMVDGYGIFKLGDFGVARTFDGTRTATMAGTESYMAPEVVLRKKYDRTVDIYSLGLVLYWALNGYRLPFMPVDRLSQGDGARAEARRVSGEPIPQPEHGSDALVAVVLKACAYHPEDRYRSADDMVADLEALLAGGTPSVASAPTQAAATATIPHGASTVTSSDTNWGDTTGATVGRVFGNSPVGSNESSYGSTATAGRSQASRCSEHTNTAPTKKVPKPVDAPMESIPVPFASKGSTGVSRRGFIIAGVEGAAAVAGAFLLSQSNEGIGNNHGANSGTTTADNIVSVENILASDGIVVASSEGSSDEPWLTYDYSDATESSATSIVGVCKNGGTNLGTCFVIRCADGSTFVVCWPTDADDGVSADFVGMMKEVAQWTNLRKVRFGIHDAGSGYEIFALGQRDDGTFVSSWGELNDEIASDTSGSWSEIADFILETTTYGEDITTDGSRQSFDVPQGSFHGIPAGSTVQVGDSAASTWPDEPALAFPANKNSSDIVLMQDGTCWSIYGEGDARGDAIRSWHDIVQCVDGGEVYAAIGSDGTVHATPNYLDGKEYYERYRQCADELSSWSGINKLDTCCEAFLGVTSGGNVLYGGFASKNDQYLFWTYDLGLSGVIDAALGNYSLLTIDEGGTVRSAKAWYLTGY
jgi:serine/threonine protein kinase